MAEPIIRFVDVQKSFGSKVIYTGLDLEVFRGETLTVIGGSGVGKSVMLKILIGLLKPEAGRVEAFGESVVSMNRQGLQALRPRVEKVSSRHNAEFLRP